MFTGKCTAARFFIDGSTDVAKVACMMAACADVGSNAAAGVTRPGRTTAAPSDLGIGLLTRRLLGVSQGAQTSMAPPYGIDAPSKAMPRTRRSASRVVDRSAPECE